MLEVMLEFKPCSLHIERFTGLWFISCVKLYHLCTVELRNVVAAALKRSFSVGFQPQYCLEVSVGKFADHWPTQPTEHESDHRGGRPRPPGRGGTYISHNQSNDAWNVPTFIYSKHWKWNKKKKRLQFWFLLSCYQLKGWRAAQQSPVITLCVCVHVYLCACVFPHCWNCRHD